MLQHYRIYLLDRNFRICVAHDVLCPDEEAACEAAAELSNDQWWELWQGRECVRRGKGTHHAPEESLH